MFDRESAAAMREVWEAELRNPDYAKRLETFGSALNWACENAPPRTTSGLAEMQYYFRKYAEVEKARMERESLSDE